MMVSKVDKPQVKEGEAATEVFEGFSVNEMTSQRITRPIKTAINNFLYPYLAVLEFLVEVRVGSSKALGIEFLRPAPGEKCQQGKPWFLSLVSDYRSPRPKR